MLIKHLHAKIQDTSKKTSQQSFSSHNNNQVCINRMEFISSPLRLVNPKPSSTSPPEEQIKSTMKNTCGVTIISPNNAISVITSGQILHAYALPEWHSTMATPTHSQLVWTAELSHPSKLKAAKKKKVQNRWVTAETVPALDSDPTADDEFDEDVEIPIIENSNFKPDFSNSNNNYYYSNNNNSPELQQQHLQQQHFETTLLQTSKENNEFLRRNLDRNPGVPTSLSFTHNSQILAVGTSTGLIFQLDASSGSFVSQIKHTSSLLHSTLASSDVTEASLETMSVDQMSISTTNTYPTHAQKQQNTINPSTIYHVNFSNSSKFLIACGEDSRTTIFDASSSNLLCEFYCR